jgi:hypothetical protein
VTSAGQLGSSLRNVGRIDDAVTLLENARRQFPEFRPLRALSRGLSTPRRRGGSARTRGASRCTRRSPRRTGAITAGITTFDGNGYPPDSTATCKEVMTVNRTLPLDALA